MRESPPSARVGPASSPARIALAAAVLVLATVAVTGHPARYVTARAGIVDDADLRAGRPAWAARAPGASLVAGPAPLLRLEASPSGGAVWAARHVPPVDPATRAYRVSVEARGEGIAGVTRRDQGARVALVSLDARGRRLWYWPAEVLRLTGETPWQAYEAVIPAAPEAGGTWLVAMVYAPAGRLEVRAPRIDVVAERPLFAWLRRGLLAAWAWLIAAASWRLARSRAAPAGRAAVLGLALAILAAGLAPQPDLNQVVGRAAELGRSAIARLGSRPVPDAGGGSEAGAAKRAAPAAAAGAGAGGAGEPAGASGEGTAAGEPRDADGGSERAPARPAAAERPPPLPPVAVSDKTGHLLAFGLLAFVTALVFRPARLRPAAACAGFAAVLQVLQRFTVTREPDLADLAFDLTGVVVGTLVAVAAVLAWRARAAGERAPARPVSPCAPAGGPPAPPPD